MLPLRQKPKRSIFNPDQKRPKWSLMNKKEGFLMLKTGYLEGRKLLL
jgi:hypothetical protein